MDIDDADFIFAQQLQEQFNRESKDSYLTEPSMQKKIENDHILALQLQEELNKEVSQQALSEQTNTDDGILAFHLQEELNKEANVASSEPVLSHKNGKVSIVDNFWELNDPNPDIHGLFLEFNSSYFWDKLKGVEVRWSDRMTLCAGLCCYEGHGGLCSIRLSLPLLKLRPRKDLVETLLHEMIHAYLFVTHNNRDHDSHGPEFLKHMHRINKLTGANITVYHNFHDEVNEYRQHWWRCNGPCRHRPPYYGFVRRAMNRAPSSNDFWWEEHRMTCGGTYEKIKEPEKNKKRKESEIVTGTVKRSRNDGASIKKFLGSSDENHPVSQSSSYSENSKRCVTYNSPNNIHSLKSSNKVTKTSQITPFTGKGHVLGSSQLQNSNNLKKHTLLSYFESNQDIPMKHTSSTNEIKVGKRNEFCTSEEKKQSEYIRGSNSASFNKLLPAGEQKLESEPLFGTLDEFWQKARNTQTSSQLKEGTLRKKFLPTGKLSTASPLNHVKTLFREDDPNNGFKRSKNQTLLDMFSSKASVQKEQSTNSNSSFENPITLDDENLHSTCDILTVICPVCNQEFENSQINTHLDKCLS